MAHDSKNQQAKQEQLKAEWVNVGLCGGMYRPARHNGHRAFQRKPDDKRPLPIVKVEDWQPHNRCC